MTGLALPDAHHVARYCPPRRTENGLPHAAAFKPRVGEGYISVNWLEFFGERDAAANIEHVRAAVGKKLRLSRHGLFAVLNGVRLFFVGVPERSMGRLANSRARAT